MKKNKLHQQNGFSLIELLIAGLIATIFLAGVIKFSQTAYSAKDTVTNEAYAVNQAKNAFNYISQDAQMAGGVITTSSHFPLYLNWINYPATQTSVTYSISINGKLQRYFYSLDPITGDIVTNTMDVAADVNPNVLLTNCVWSNEDGQNPKLNRLTLNITISVGSVNLSRQFIITPRVVQSSSQILSAVSLTSSPNPANYGSIVTLSAAVTPAAKSGTVTFFDGSNTIAICPIDSTGHASYPVINMTVGVHSLSAIYSGDATYRASTSDPLIQTINKGLTTVTLTSSSNPSTYGQLTPPVTFTATVSPSVATGSVQFTIDGSNFGSPVTLIGGSANSGTTTTLTAGNHSITAVYSGDDNYATSTGSLTQTINKNGTTTSLGSSLNPSYLTNSVTFTATVTPTTPTVPTGTVTFKDGTTVLATVSLNTSGQATYNTSALTAAIHTITAIYSGDSNYITSTGTLTQTVIGAVNAAKSTLLPLTSNIIANGISTLVLTVQVNDINGNHFTTGGLINVTITKLSGNGTISSPVVDNGNGTYSATVTSSTLVGTNGVFVAAIGGSTVNNGGGSQTQATVNYVTGNTIEITTSMLWSAITTGSGPGGQPSPADTINIHGAGTTPATGIILTVDVPNGQAYAINVNTTSSVTPSYATLTFLQAQGVTVGTITIGSTGSRKGIIDMSAGTLTPTYTGTFLTITNSMVLTSGNYTFTYGIGTVIYGGAAAQTINAIPYYNLMTNVSGTKTMGGAVTVNGNLTVGGATTLTLGGALTVNGNLVINTGTILNVGSYDITLKGNWTNSGTFTQGTRTVTLNGTTVQSMTGATTFYNLTLNNAAGLTISNDETITHTLTLTAGKITTGSNTVIIPSGGSVSRTSGYVYGNFRKWVSTTTPTFEVGATNYNPVNLTITGLTAGYMTVSTNNGQHPNIGSATIQTSSDVSMYWTLTNSGISFTSFTVKFNFVAGDVTGGSPTSASWKVGRYSGTLPWTYPAVGTKAATSTLTGPITFANAFGDFILGQP